MLGWTGLPDYEGVFAQGEFEIDVATNTHGFRDEDFTAKRARAERSGARRVALLGDSFVWGWGVAAEERVGAELARNTGWAVFHLAQCGYGTDQEYLSYLEHRDAIAPDLVLLFFFENDFADVNAAVRYEGQAKPRYRLTPSGIRLTNLPVPRDRAHWDRKRALASRRGDCPPAPGHRGRAADGGPGPLARLAERSQLANWLRFRVGQLSAGGDLQAPPRRRPRQEAARSRVALALIDALATRVHEDGAHFGVVLVPEKAQVLAGETTGAWQRTLLEHCEQTGLACLDLLPTFSGDAASYFRIDAHWTARGHRRAAAQVRAFAESRERLETGSDVPRGASDAR